MMAVTGDQLPGHGLPSQPARRGVVRRWAGDLGLGVRLVAGGGRQSFTRLVLTAVGVGLGVALLLLACSAPAVYRAHEDRGALRSYDVVQPKEPVGAGDRTVLVASADTTYRDVSVRGLVLQADGARPVLPPGVAAMPHPGEMLVSPALRALLSSSDGALLRPRLPYRIVGTIGDAGLAGPNEYAFYAGSDQLAARTGDGRVERVDRFGAPADHHGLDPVLLLLTVVAVAVLLVPIAVFIGAAVRFGAESRDRQQAALRLVGADRSMTRRIAAGEALVGALLGLVVGAVLFLAGRQLIELVTLEDLSVFASDVRPDPVLVVLIAVLVPVSAVAVSVLALRRVVVEPLGVVRRATAVKRRLWWRLVVPAVGIGLLVPLLGGIKAGGERFSTLQVGAGVTLLLVGVAVLLPWLVEAVVRRLGGGSVAWQLAIRRLQLNSGSAARVVSGIAVAVAGAVGLLTLFAGVQHAYQQPTHQDPTRAQVDVNVPRTLSLAQAHELTGRFAATPGVTSVFGVSSTEIGATQVGADGQLASIGGCADGDTFLATAPGAGDSVVPRPGTRAAVLSGNAERVTGSWTVPATARTVRARTAPDGSSQLGVLATRSAVDARLLGQLRETVYVRVDPSRPDTLERVRNVAAAADPLSNVLELTASRTDGTLVTIEHGILGGATAVLLLIGASMLVTVLEQLRERRRLLAVLTAFGTRRGTLTASVLWQTAVPVFLGLLLAVVGGVLLGAVLLRMTSEPVSFAWAQIGEIAGVAAAVVLLVTVLSMPALWRLMRPEGMRTE
jgi:hypothetical protein